MNLRRGDRPPLVIGHRGAAAVAPENTLAALQAAVDAGAQLVEFDVGPDLRLAHSSREVPEQSLSLDEALEFLRAHELGVQLDAKLPGYEEELVEALRRHGLGERALISTTWAGSARRLARIAPTLPRAIGYPHDRYGIARVRWPQGLTAAGAVALRQAMPVRVPLLLRLSRADTLSLHHTLCSRATVSIAHALGAPVLAWTANDPVAVRRLVSIGVDAIVSDDPGMVLQSLATLLAS
ncbi:MAG TPA: glycerophosphodiester phosphodiesterase [Gaiellaceae bacterium]